MATLLTCAVIASMVGLLLPPAVRIARLDPQGRMELRRARAAFAPE